MNAGMTAEVELTEPVPNEDLAICAECGGECCKHIPGLCHPKDFKDFDADLETALRSGDYQIDWWEGDPDIYYVRPTVVDAIGKLFHGSWGAACTLLTDNGCRLVWSDRPFACRAIVPSATCGAADGMDSMALKKRLVDTWRPRRMQKALIAVAARIDPERAEALGAE